VGIADDPRRDRDIEALLRATLDTRAIDQPRAARVRDEVHREWAAIAGGGRQRRRLWWTLGGVAAAAALVIAVRPSAGPDTPSVTPASAPATGPVATVRYVRGELARRSGVNAVFVPLRTGDTVGEGTVVQTDGATSGSLTLADGVDLRIDASSEVVFTGTRRLDLRRGRLYLDTGDRRPGAEAAAIEIVTTDAVVRDVGTRFVVTGGATVAVAVREGRVQLDRRGVVHDAGPGEQLIVTAEGAVTLTRRPPFGSEWDWIVGAAPPLPVDGRTLEEFLTWVEREGGRSVRFASAALGRSARGTIVYGTIEGLTVDEALAVVLPTCGLTHRVDGAVITIEAADEKKGPR
jgi:hypothetical protein